MTLQIYIFFHFRCNRDERFRSVFKKIENTSSLHTYSKAMCKNYVFIGIHILLIIYNFERQSQMKDFYEGIRKSPVFLDERAALLEGWLLGYKWCVSRQPARF